MSNIIVIGGGAAGMMAAATAAANASHQVLLLEQNEKLGKKLYITGKGRCNFTNACDVEDFFPHIVTNAKFLYSALYGFTGQDAMAFFERCGMKVKVERGGRAFPCSDHASDVTGALQRELKRRGVSVRTNTKAERIMVQNGAVRGVMLDGGAILAGNYVVIATGGCSYPSTGSTGDGFLFARQTGHEVTRLFPGLVPMVTREPYVTAMQGLSLKNVVFTVWDGRKKLYEDFGEMLFTHFGISGPLVLSASSVVGAALDRAGELACEINLKPALSEEQLDARILRELQSHQNRNFGKIFQHMLPSKMIPVVIELSGISPDRKANAITKRQRADIVGLLRHFPMTVTSLRGFGEAIITRGGVNIREINPSTLESKKVKGLFFAGEVLDVDAFTGGYNLQIAWSTGNLAGRSIAERENESDEYEYCD